MKYSKLIDNMCTLKDNRPIASSLKLKNFKIKGIVITSIEKRSRGNYTIQYFLKRAKVWVFFGGEGGVCML